MVGELVALVAQNTLDKCSTLLINEVHHLYFVFLNPFEASVNIFVQVFATFQRIDGLPSQVHNHFTITCAMICCLIKGVRAIVIDQIEVSTSFFESTVMSGQNNFPLRAPQLVSVSLAHGAIILSAFRFQLEHLTHFDNQPY